MLSRSFVRLLTVATATFSTAYAAIYEAEAGTLSGTTVLTELAGYSGTGYVGGFDESADSLTFTFPITKQGLYDLKIRYAGIYGNKYTQLSLNGGGGGDVNLPESTTWATADAGQALLNVGTNTVKLTNHWGWYLIDYLEVTESAPRAPHKVQNVLVNTASTSSTKSLFSYLLSQYGSKILSGQQEISSITWVEQNVGKTPAIAGLDLMDYSPSRVERGTVGTAIDEAIAWDKRGGILTLTWHWNAPNGLIDVAGKEWWRGFYTEATTFDISQAMADTTNANYQLLIRDIDAIAVQLKRLQDANIPVLWRPLHEAEGGWFWWGAKGPEPCKKLYRVVYDRLTNYHKLNNLIWVWNSIASSWYPGADVVDVVSFDSYPVAGDHNPLSTQFNQLVSLTGDTKLIAVTEVGSIPDPALIQAYGLRWSWWCTWSGDFISGGSHNSLAFLKSAYSHSSVVNLDGLPANWKNYGGPVTTTTTKTTTTTTTTKSTTTATPTVTSTKTTTTTTTTKTTSTTSTPTSTQVAQKWGQCGGVSWTGPTVCVSGTTCTPVSPPYYYQCL